MQTKCLMGNSKIANLFFGEAKLLHITIKIMSGPFQVTGSNTPRQNLSFGWSNPFGTG